jgi:hypothetical protein
LALLSKVEVPGSLWTFGNWWSTASGGEGTLRASLRSEALNRVRKASANGIATRGGRGDRSGVSSAFRRLSSNVEGSWLTPKELVDLLKGGRGVGSAVFISKGEGKVVRYW